MHRAEVNGEMIEFERAYIGKSCIFFMVGTLTVAWFFTKDVKQINLC